MNSPKLTSKLFIFSLLLSFFFIILAIHKQRQLNQLNSRLSLLESSVEEMDHELRGKEILEKEITSLKDKIDSIQDFSDAKRSHIEEQELESIVKNQCSNFTCHVKPLFDFLTDITIGAYNLSKNTFISLLVKFLRSAIPFLQKLYMTGMPYFDQIASVTKIYLVSLWNLLKKISMFLFTILMDRLNGFILWCLELEAAD
ncbi:uncharacterized protein LOC109811591 [Cajanus cajan]|uniref:uncharacterized protein LOC109811591 n=1 Tax=Cajanus cajan TaxID=3821 RepID=UPI0010FAE44A|nr:uncharacterized protein LOC109811591 [Cajanus cajan]